jgi:superfamily II DNA/RNA helicase
MQVDLRAHTDSSQHRASAGRGVQVGSLQHAEIVLSALCNLPGGATNDLVAQANELDHQVMIFLNTAEAVQRFADSLRELGVRCAEFHQQLRPQWKEDSLRRFRDGEERILVCTDSAARGLDLPNVRHVVQAEFALNVVQHQHRVGRASRAGRAGRSTNLYGSAAEPLVASIRGVRAQQELDFAAAADGAEVVTDDSAERGSSIERSFSRRRGFRRNIKRALQNSSS